MVVAPTTGGCDGLVTPPMSPESRNLVSFDFVASYILRSNIAGQWRFLVTVHDSPPETYPCPPHVETYDQIASWAADRDYNASYAYFLQAPTRAEFDACFAVLDGDDFLPFFRVEVFLRSCLRGGLKHAQEMAAVKLWCVLMGRFFGARVPHDAVHEVSKYLFGSMRGRRLARSGTLDEDVQRRRKTLARQGQWLRVLQTVEDLSEAILGSRRASFDCDWMDPFAFVMQTGS
jgi:hypothetical protein